MPQFDFYQDTRIRTWERCHFKVEAESYEAAVAIIKNFCDCDVNNHEEEVEFGPLEILFEHSEKIDPGKNEGRTTIRIYTEDDTRLKKKHGAYFFIPKNIFFRTFPTGRSSNDGDRHAKTKRPHLWKTLPPTNSPTD